MSTEPWAYHPLVHVLLTVSRREPSEQLGDALYFFLSLLVIVLINGEHSFARWIVDAHELGVAHEDFALRFVISYFFAHDKNRRLDSCFRSLEGVAWQRYNRFYDVFLG